MVLTLNKEVPCRYSPLPSWFQKDVPDPSALARMRRLLEKTRLHTICQSARCPNLGECWKRKTATFLILGGTCTRACRFCAVPHGSPDAPDPEEPRRLATAVEMLGLRYVVITSVTRDDLEDGGAAHFAATIRAVRRLSPRTHVEVLIPDFLMSVRSLQTVVDARPQVIGHNMETVSRLYPEIRPQGDYRRSLQVFRTVRRMSREVVVKSGFMVGLGETDGEVADLLADLYTCGCTAVTIGQYLSPSSSGRHTAVRRFVAPVKFDEYKQQARAMGFRTVTAGPLVRSSYLAEEGYRHHRRAVSPGGPNVKT